MKLIPMKCPSCGSKLKVKEGQKQVTCEFCRATTIIDDEKIVIEHKIKDANSETKLENALVYLNKLKKYDKAKELFLELLELRPGDPEVLEGIIKSETKNFTSKSFDSELLEETYDDYCKLVEEDNDFKKKYTKYIKSLYSKDENTNVKKQISIPETVIIAIAVLIVCILFFLSERIFSPKDAFKSNNQNESTTSQLIEEYYSYIDTIDCDAFAEGIVDMLFANKNNIFITKDKVYEISRSGLYSNDQECREIASLGDKIKEVGELRELDTRYDGSEVDEIYTENKYVCNLSLTNCKEDYWSGYWFSNENFHNKYGDIIDNQKHYFAFEQYPTGYARMKYSFLYSYDTNSLYYIFLGGSGEKIDLPFDENEKIISIGANITTNKGFYYVKKYIVNETECNKYVDVPCVERYGLFKLERLSYLYDDLYFVGRYIVDKDNRVYWGYSKD